jgi:hypothetical protein
MPQLTIADLLAHRIALRDNEAAALTLAVALALDRHRTSGECVCVPDDRAIALHRDGRITFLSVSRTSAVDDVSALSSLLLRLLSVRNPDRARQLVSDRETPVALRARLVDMSSDDPAALATVYWRAASAMRRRAHADPARPERRRQHPPATELRRYIRHLEQQLFAERVRALRARWIRRRARRIVWLAWIVVAGACTVVAATSLTWTSRPQAPPSVSEAARVEPVAAADVASPPVTRAAAVRHATPHHRRIAIRLHERPRRAPSPPRVVVRSVDAPATPPARRNRATLVPWGTRSAPWTVSTP